MPKLEAHMFERTNSTPPNFKKHNAKDIVRAIPVSESKREACKAIQLGVMTQIEERINAERKTTETKIKNDEKAGKPFRKLKEQLTNPRIKRSKSSGAL